MTGGALGSLLGQVLHVSANERKILLAAGAAAGMAATFGAPLAAVVLAIELLLFEFSARAFVPLVVATSVAGAVHAALFGTGPLFSVPAHDFAGLAQLPSFGLLGIGCGLLATSSPAGCSPSRTRTAACPVAESWHPVLGAARVGADRRCSCRARSASATTSSTTSSPDGSPSRTLAALAVGKLVVWWLALGSGTSGGTLAPILLISSCAGGSGRRGSSTRSCRRVSPSAFALVAMAATFGAATRAPFAAIVFVFELTRDYDAILPLMRRHGPRRPGRSHAADARAS